MGECDSYPIASGIAVILVPLTRHSRESGNPLPQAPLTSNLKQSTGLHLMIS